MLCESLDLRLCLPKMMIVVSFCHPTRPGNVFQKFSFAESKQYFCFNDIFAALGFGQ